MWDSAGHRHSLKYRLSVKWELRSSSSERPSFFNETSTPSKDAVRAGSKCTADLRTQTSTAVVCFTVPGNTVCTRHL